MLRKPSRSRSQLLVSRASSDKVKKKRRKERPPWDNTVKDLNLYKPTSQELERNHELHRPRKDHERIFRRIESSSAYLHDSDNISFMSVPDDAPGRNSAGRKGEGASRKKIYDQENELKDLLSETDKTFAKMENIFGDCVYKNKGVPIITKAPNYTGDSKSIHVFDAENPSYYDTLSESLVKYPELNPVINDESISSISGDETPGDEDSIFQTKMNMHHYQQVLQKNSDEIYPTCNEIDLADNESHIEELKKHVEVKKNANQKNGCLPVDIPEKKIENKSISSSSTALQTFDDMKGVLEILQAEILEYEKETGRENVTTNVRIPNNFSGFTSNLLSMIVRLTHHMNESEKQLKAELAMREEILDMFDDQRTLIDILTNNLLETRKANEALKIELSSHKSTSETYYSDLKTRLNNLEKKFSSLQTNEGSIYRRPLLPTDPLQNITNNVKMPEWVYNQ